MDPNEALNICRDRANVLMEAIDADAEGIHTLPEVAEMVDAFQALDGWLSKQGFLPKDWSHERT